MENNKANTLLKYYGLIVVIIVILVLSSTQNLKKSPKLRHYIAKVTSPIQDNDFQNARQMLENFIFQTTNDAILRNPNLTYTEALDKILPVNQNIGTPQSGIIIVIQNNGKAPANNVQIEIDLQVPIEKYAIFSENTAFVLQEDYSKGKLKITINIIDAIDKVNIAFLLSNQYEVSLIASRTEDLKSPALPTDLNNPMRMIEVMATQTEIATYNKNNVENFLEFRIEYALDKIQPIVVISSNEVNSYFYEVQKNKITEQSLFINTFLK